MRSLVSIRGVAPWSWASFVYPMSTCFHWSPAYAADMLPEWRMMLMRSLLPSTVDGGSVSHTLHISCMPALVKGTLDLSLRSPSVTAKRCSNILKHSASTDGPQNSHRFRFALVDGAI